jgi:cytochrome c5
MRLARCVFLLAAVFAAGCDDYIYQSGGGGEVTGADWTSVKAFFDNECNACHSGTLPILPDDIEADITSGAGEYVVAGSAADSSLWRVVSGELADGDFDVMPLGSGPLPADEIAFLKEWIDAGASLEESGTAPTGTDTYSANWVGISEMLHDKCSACHASGGIAAPELPADLQTDLVDGTGLLVVSGSLEGSLLWRVCSNNLDAGDFGVMPQGSTGLDATSLVTLEEWILAGASLN